MFDPANRSLFNDHSLTLIPSNSILGVLQTALPSSLVAEAITNSAAVASEIASQFAAGETPTWFSAHPSDIQGYLAPTDMAGVSSLTAAASSLVTGGVSAVSNATSSASSASITTAFRYLSRPTSSSDTSLPSSVPAPPRPRAGALFCGRS